MDKHTKWNKITWLVKNLSIKKTYFIFTLVALLTATLLIAGVKYTTSSIKASILETYATVEKFYYQYEFAIKNGENVIEDKISFYIKNGWIMPKSLDGIVIKLCEIIDLLLFPVFYCAGLLISAYLFYKIKLKKPVEILEDASKKIANNNLNFKINYGCLDEMGKLCHSFEQMRGALMEDSCAMWQSMIERKRLNSAFSHDLRTPLTVLRGYTDYLTKYLPEDKVPKDKVISTIATMSSHIKRLENYVQSMNALQRLEDIIPSIFEVDYLEFCMELKDTAKIYCKNFKLKVEFEQLNKNVQQHLIIYIDADMVTQVFENLLSNAVRFAKGVLKIQFFYVEDYFSISVEDDGTGFTDLALKKGDSPFFKEENHGQAEKQIHFGLGLNICKILCEKHGGGLQLANSVSHGAIVTAGFLCSRKAL